MIHYSYNQYEIKIFNDPPNHLKEKGAEQIKSSHNYNFIYKDENCLKYVPNSCHGIKVLHQENTYKNALLVCCDGGPTHVHEKSVIINNNSILILVGNHLFSLSLPDLKLNWNIKVDSATCFSIYKIEENEYIIHGELEISKVNAAGEIKWQYSGRDIFTSLDGEKNFEIKKDFIWARDWNNNEYKIGFDGKSFKS